METKIGTNSCTAIKKLNGKKISKYCIAIPAYKEELDIAEKISLKRLHEVLVNKSNVYLFCPVELNVSKYKEIFPEIQVMEFGPENFTSIDAYSHLCMKYEFYDSFSEYEYMIIYQLDCYLMKDDLEEWCYKGYDYIGAPIMVPHIDWKNFSVNQQGQISNFTPAVGNGGFSLRNIDVFKILTDPNGELRQRYNLTDEALKDIKYEDVYFCVELWRLYDFEKPKFDEAMKFAIDMNPDLIYNRYGFSGYPTCIHAFDKNIPFWRSRISDFDNDELYNHCYEKNKKFIDTYYLHKNENTANS